MLDWLQPAVFTVVQLFVIGLLVEALVENILWLVKGEMSKEKLIPMITAIIVALAARLDLFFYAGINLYLPVLGYVLSGILIARGANIIHDLVKLLGQAKQQPGEENPQS